MDLKNKKVLVVGLGALGGGVATAQWLVKQGADVTVTDLRRRKELASSVRALGGAAKKTKFVLGEHRTRDFTGTDLIVLGPGVKLIGNKFIAAAKKKNIPIVNDLSIFLNEVKNPVIAVTGTRGKTTTANWTAHFLQAKYPRVRASGNSSDDALLKLLPRLAEDKKTPAVLELSSFQLEALDPRLDNSDELSSRRRAPDVAVITNIFRDHLNRHKTMRNYARAKANIFQNQTKRQKLILNFDNPWTKFFLREHPKSKTFFISLRKVPSSHPFLIRARAHPQRPREGGNRKMSGGVLFLAVAGMNKKIIFCERGKTHTIFSGESVDTIEALGEHNVYNFLAAALAAHLMGVSWKTIEKRVYSLPQIALRQEIILRKKNFRVVNDSAGTSPEATIAAIKRFAREGEVILITGGTDKNLAFKELAQKIKKNIVPEDLFLLNGSATKKLLTELKKISYFKKQKPRLFETLQEILISIRKILNTKYSIPTTVVFSPGSASFEKFKNEFDRGARFTALAKRLFR